MRIISGTYRGKIITAPTKLPVRPTTDFAKTGLFNILNHSIDFEKISALDLYSGTGNIGYELISRGCINLTMVDQDKNCIRFISETIEKLNVMGVYIVKSEVFRFIENCFQTFDLIFADPPYEFTETEKLISRIFDNKLLNPGGKFILEHGPGHDLSAHPFYTETRKYGHVSFSFFYNPI